MQASLPGGCVEAPEISANSAGAALTLLLGGLSVLRRFLAPNQSCGKLAYLFGEEPGRRIWPIYTLTHEELVADPLGQLSCLYTWLGVDPSFRPARIGIPDNVLPSAIEQVRDPGLLDRVRHSAMFRRVAPLLPPPLRKLGAALVATHRVKPAEVDTSAVRAFLRAECQQQIAELSRLLQREFPEWKSVYAAEPGAPAVIDGGRRLRTVARG